MNAIPQMNKTTDIFDSIPTNPREKSEWCHKHFGPLISGHIGHLKRFKVLPEKDQGLSFTGVFENGFTKVQYGSLLIEFPYNINNLKTRDWLDAFDIIVDGTLVILDSGISAVPDIQQSTSKKTSRVMERLLPPPLPKTVKPNQIMVRRSIRIQPKI